MAHLDDVLVVAKVASIHSRTLCAKARIVHLIDLQASLQDLHKLQTTVSIYTVHKLQDICKKLSLQNYIDKMFYFRKDISVLKMIHLMGFPHTDFA
jgi:hypothetical protein